QSGAAAGPCRGACAPKGRCHCCRRGSVESGFVTSLSRPGGNITGVTAVTRELAPKTIELLRDAVPGLTRLAVLTNPSRPEHAEYVRLIQAVRPQGMQLQVFPFFLEGEHHVYSKRSQCVSTDWRSARRPIRAATFDRAEA